MNHNRQLTKIILQSTLYKVGIAMLEMFLEKEKVRKINAN